MGVEQRPTTRHGYIHDVTVRAARRFAVSARADRARARKRASPPHEAVPGVRRGCPPRTRPLRRDDENLLRTLCRSRATKDRDGACELLIRRQELVLGSQVYRPPVGGHVKLPMGGHETCPVVASRTARWWP